MRCLLFLFMFACGSRKPAAPPIAGTQPPPATTTAAPATPAGDVEKCIADFVAGQELPLASKQLAQSGGPAFTVFSVQWGREQDCQLGCFRSWAHGVALSCKRLGWILIEDHHHGAAAPRNFPHFQILPDDQAALFDEATWKAVSGAEFFRWLSDTPGVPEPVRERARKRAAEEADGGLTVGE